MMASWDEDLTRDWPASTIAVESRTRRIGTVIDGRYRSLRVLGSGGMGLVMEVERIADGARFALKVCRLTGAGLQRFAREVRLMRKVRHPNVVPIVDANLRANPPYFVMPLARGSLQDELPGSVGRVVESLDAFRQACLGIQAIHGCGIVHRDIKPANILRFEDGRVAVSDFGVAKLELRDTSVLTQTMALVGTLGYLAPEQLLPDGSRRADTRTDVYQLGKVLYQLLTGRSPALIAPEALPRGLAHVIQRATSVNPDDRYGDVGALLDAIRYYQLAQDPRRNAREALENLVVQAEDLLRRREFRDQNVREILALLTPSDDDPVDDGASIERFDRLPDGLLPVMTSEFASEFATALRVYVASLPGRVGSFPFAYADHVARRMRLVFRAARLPELKTLALEATLLAAVALHRFAAMDAFNRMLASVHDIDDALPVSEMLRARERAYAEVAVGAAADQLHPAIRAVREEWLRELNP